MQRQTCNIIIWTLEIQTFLERISYNIIIWTLEIKTCLERRSADRQDNYLEAWQDKRSWDGDHWRIAPRISKLRRRAVDVDYILQINMCDIYAAGSGTGMYHRFWKWRTQRHRKNVDKQKKKENVRTKNPTVIQSDKCKLKKMSPRKSQRPPPAPPLSLSPVPPPPDATCLWYLCIHIKVALVLNYSVISFWLIKQVQYNHFISFTYIALFTWSRFI